MEEEPRNSECLYCGVIWCKDDEPGERFEIHATSPEMAKRLMEERFGVGHVFTLWSPDQAEKLR